MTNKRKNWVEKLFARTPSRRSPQFEQYNSARRKLRLETLEDRSLLTAIGVSTIDSIAAEGVGPTSKTFVNGLALAEMFARSAPFTNARRNIQRLYNLFAHKFNDAAKRFFSCVIRREIETR
ncbi:MAG: hypothetical protein PHO46_10080 [Thermoguttaceae bacterium]|jgi:hypothetical protein|nr:hypothetical protein [Thermoguttaceae bacterium]